MGIVVFARRFGPPAAALYAWSPLAVVEIAGQGHTEALVVVGLAGLLAGGRLVPWRSLGVTVAGLAKLWPLALLPLAWRRDGWAGVAASATLGAALTALVAAPGALTNALESVALFFGVFDEYALPYRAAKWALHPALGDAAGRAASVALAAAFAGAAGWAVATDDGTDRRLARAVTGVVLAFALTTATLHPWYLVPVLFVLPLLQPKKPILWLAGTASVLYLAYELPWASAPVLWVGWGGAAWVWWRVRRATATPPPRARLRSRSGRPVERRRGSGGAR